MTTAAQRYAGGSLFRETGSDVFIHGFAPWCWHIVPTASISLQVPLEQYPWARPYRADALMLMNMADLGSGFDITVCKLILEGVPFNILCVLAPQQCVAVHYGKDNRDEPIPTVGPVRDLFQAVALHHDP